MGKKKREPTFGDMIATANIHIADLRGQHGERRFIPQLIWEAFTASYKIAAEQRYYTDFGPDLARVLTYHNFYKSLKEIEKFWQHWPIQVTVFGMFQDQGSSAMEVAARFSESIKNAALAIRVIEFKTFYSDEFRQPDIERWAVALAKELQDNTLPLSIWPHRIMRRDYEVLASRANEELRQFEQLASAGNVAINAAPEHEEVWVTIEMLHKVIVKQFRIDGVTKCIVSRRKIERLAENWKSRYPMKKRNREFSWTEARLTLLDSLKTDIGPIPTSVVSDNKRQ